MLRNIYIDRVLKNKIFGKKKNLKNSEMVGSSLGSDRNNNDSSLKIKRMVSYNKRIKNEFFSKNSFLSKVLVGQRIYVHNGREFISVKVTPSMVGFKIGEFFYDTRNRKSRTGK